jgi:hypothetical protein
MTLLPAIKRSEWPFNPYIHSYDSKNVVMISFAKTPSGKWSKYWHAFEIKDGSVPNAKKRCTEKCIETLPKLPEGYTWTNPSVYTEVSSVKSNPVKNNIYANAVMWTDSDEIDDDGDGRLFDLSRVANGSSVIMFLTEKGMKDVKSGVSVSDLEVSGNIVDEISIHTALECWIKHGKKMFRGKGKGK